MSEDLNDFLVTRLSLPAVAAWGLLQSERPVNSHSYKDWLPAPRIEQAVTRLSQAAAKMSAEHGIRPQRLRWSFELALIHLALREDGTCLVVFLENSPEANEEHVQSVLQDFMGFSSI